VEEDRAVSVTMQPVEQLTSVELVSLLAQANRLANAAGRPELVARLTRARARVSGRQMRVAVVGARGQGASTLVRVLDQIPADQLAGASFADVSGRPGSNQVRVPEPASVDVVLFVSDAGHEYSPSELDALARIRGQGTAVVCVLTKIDAYPGWNDTQRANRRRLQAAKLDSPTIPLLPVSAALSESGRQRGDDSLVVSSGVPQLLEFLGDQVGTKVEPALRDSVLTELRAVTNQLGTLWNAELDELHGAEQSPQDRQQRAIAELERRQQLSASWQLTLGDGATELMSEVDFELRDRLREVMEGAEEQITKGGVTGSWERFDGAVRRQVTESVNASFQLATARSQQLAKRVGARLAGNKDGSTTGVKLPEVWLDDPDEALRKVKPMNKPEDGGMFARVINSVRGSYGGILMVGVLTSLAGLQLISPWSVGAGVLLGLFTFWEDRKNGKERGKAEAKMALAKLMDAVNFRVGDELRLQLRTVHRTLRDHFTELNDQRLRAASDAARAAMEAPQRNGDQQAARLSEVQNYLAELRQLRIRTAARPSAS
jgi:hypothetical protein